MYYPSSQIISNLYTNGNEYIIKGSKLPYSGFYWKTISGKTYIGKTPQSKPTQELIPFNVEGGKTNNINDVNSYYNQYDDASIEYINLTLPTTSPPLPPIYSAVFPSSQDYQVGEFTRYFCKKVNEIIYLEINKDTYNKLVAKDPTYLFQIYSPFKFQWIITGEKEKVYISNKSIVRYMIEKFNFVFLDKYLKEDYLKYYK